MYTFKTSERNNDKATEFETKSLLYLMTNAPDSDNVDLFIIDCFNDVTGSSANFSHSWDVQSKGVASMTPGKIGAALYTLYANYLSDIEFTHYILFIPPVKAEYITGTVNDVFIFSDFKENTAPKVRDGLRKEIAERKDNDVISNTTDSSINSFLSTVNFVVDNYGKADYIKRIIQFKSLSKLDDVFLTKIFEEIRARQSTKKISNVNGKSVSSISEALDFDKHLHRKDLELLVVNRIIGNDLFAARGVPLYFLPEVKNMDPEDIVDLLLDCKAKIGHTLFNKNNKKSFWQFLEQIMQLVTKYPNFDINDIYAQIPAPIKDMVFTLDKISTLYLISVVKEGVKYANS